MTAAPESRVMEGFQTVVELLSRTLGPSRGGVLNEIGRGSSEYVNDSATLVRRITALPGRHENAGAAIARDLVAGMGRRYGDGGATAAVLAGTMLAHATRVCAAGANPVLVRNGIGLGVAAAGDALKAQALPVTDAEDLVGLARAITADRELAAALGEIVSELGPNGAVEIEEHAPNHLAYEYLEGPRWRAYPADRALLAGASTELTLIEPAVVVADVEFTRVAQAQAVLEIARATPGRPPLLIIARDISGEALRMLRVNDNLHAVTCAPVALSTSVMRRAEDLDDIALLTGAEVLSDELGRPVEKAVPAYFGAASRALIERGHLTIEGGAGRREAVADRAASLRTCAWERDDGTGRRLRLRQARLLGRVACVRIGAPTETEVAARKTAARTAIRLLQEALDSGTVPGGGVAYLDCIPAVEARRADRAGTDEALGMDAVLGALSAPFRRIARNAGIHDPAVVLAGGREPRYGLDAETGAYTQMQDAGITDIGSVSAGALEAAGAVAGLLACAEVVRGHG